MIGREKEREILESVVRDDKSHFIAVYGRRRIGKTFLIREAYGYRFTFQHAGLSEGSMGEQLLAFEGSLKESGHIVQNHLKNWIEAFEELKDLIRASSEKKKVIFIDELSWMDTTNSRLLTALEQFWNGWASARRDIVLITCTSATHWMLSHIVHNKGGLYHRLTEQFALHAFSLSECEQYIQSENIAWNRSQILQYYMVFGGVPFYWTFLKKGESPQQAIDRILFAEDAPLKDEFQYLYASIFKNPRVHLQIIQTLAQKKVGMTREELITISGIINSGDLTVKLEELENCGFIRKYTAFGMKKKNAMYQLIDCFTLFYYRFLADEPTDEHFWINQINTPTVNTWLGLSFERVCLLHIDRIKQKLGISGIHTDINSWFCKKDPENGIFGSQIDLLIVRADRIINLCEMKYSEYEFTVTEKTDKDIRKKIADLTRVTGTRNAIHPILITPSGIVDNSYAGNIQAVITMEDLFG